MMNLRLLAWCLIASLSFVGLAQAQPAAVPGTAAGATVQGQEVAPPPAFPPALPDLPAEHIAKAQKLLETLGFEPALRRQLRYDCAMLMAPMHQFLKRQGDTAIQEELKPFFAEFTKIIEDDIYWPNVIKHTAGVLATRFSPEELDQLTAFYASPLGRKFVAHAPSPQEPHLQDYISGVMIDYIDDIHRAFTGRLKQAHHAVLARQREQAGIAAGRPFPELAGTCLDGSAWRLSQLQGKTVLVLSWVMQDKSWADKLGALRDIYQQHHGRGLEILGLNLNAEDELQDLGRYLALNPMPWPVMPSVDHALETVLQKLQPNPGEMFLVGPDGVLRAVNPTLEELPGLLEATLAKPAAKESGMAP